MKQDKIIENKQINHGFLIPEVKEEDYKFGSGQVSTDNPIQLDGQWDEYLPIDEEQNRNNLETFACTCYGSQNQIEILLKRLYNL